MSSRAPRAILADGTGRVAVLGVAAGSLLPLAILVRFGNAPVAQWAAAHRESQDATWHWLALLGSPLVWSIACVLAFGLAAGMVWQNTARWVVLMALCVVWAGLVNIAVGGAAAGAATAGAMAAAVGLWQPRAWPFAAAAAVLAATGRTVLLGMPASTMLLTGLLGALGALVIEFAWHTVAPDAPPRRGEPLRS
jgi:hypothetical protein